MAAETARDAAQLAETNAETAETNAETAETNAETAETNAETAATNAASSASAASTSATNASNSASAASTSATNASNSASAASTSATNASNSASAASTSASNASTSASNAATSATAASNAQTAAETARDQTLTAYDNFDDRYLGTKSSNPTLDNDGNALVAGALYFNSTDGAMRVYTGTAWVDAYAAGTSFLAKANNLSDLPDASVARTNLGLAIGTNVQAYDAQLADVAGLTPTDNGVIIGNGSNFVVESGSTLRTSLGLAIGTDVQAYDADLATIAGLTPTNNYAIIGNGTSWTSSALPASGVTSVTGTSPISSSGGSTPAISLDSGYGDTQNPYGSKTANYILAAPNGSAGAPTFRAIVAADVPTLNQNTTGSAATLTTGRTISISGDLTYTSPSFDGSSNVTAASTLATVNSNTGSFGSSSSIPVITVNGKGLVTAVSTATVPSSAVLQVIQPAVYTTPFSTTSGTATSTGFSATITPTSASSKILIIAYSTLGVPTTGMNGHIDLRRGTSTTIATDFYVTYGAADYLNAAFTGVYLDSPSTTSATTYYLYAYRDGAAGTFYVGSRRDGGSPVTTSITLMEIAG